MLAGSVTDQLCAAAQILPSIFLMTTSGTGLTVESCGAFVGRYGLVIIVDARLLSFCTLAMVTKQQKLQFWREKH